MLSSCGWKSAIWFLTQNSSYRPYVSFSLSTPFPTIYTSIVRTLSLLFTLNQNIQLYTIQMSPTCTSLFLVSSTLSDSNTILSLRQHHSFFHTFPPSQSDANMSIEWTAAQFFHDKDKVKTLFSYHDATFAMSISIFNIPQLTSSIIGCMSNSFIAYSHSRQLESDQWKQINSPVHLISLLCYSNNQNRVDRTHTAINSTWQHNNETYIICNVGKSNCSCFLHKKNCIHKVVC